jgi:hypothetical protein
VTSLLKETHTGLLESLNYDTNKQVGKEDGNYQHVKHKEPEVGLIGCLHCFLHYSVPSLTWPHQHCSDIR